MGVVWLLILYGCSGLLQSAVGDNCYQHVCQGTGCLQSNISAGGVMTCNQTSKGCQVTLVTGFEMALCVAEDDDCMPVFSSINGSQTTSLCCTGDLCNTGIFPTNDPSKEQCYSMQCDYEDCLEDLQDKAVFCDKQSGVDCVLMQMTQTTNGTTTHHSLAGCQLLDGQDVCEPRLVKTADMSINTGCCSTNVCNHGNPVIPATGDYCYSLHCIGPTDDCLETQISAGRVPVCKMDPTAGCFLNKTTIPGSITVMTGCVPSEVICPPLQYSVGGMTMTTSCCNSRLCNSGDGSSVGPTDSPVTRNKCYSMSCAGQDSDECLGVKVASSTTYCDKGQHGCMFIMAYFSGSSYLQASCATEACQQSSHYVNASNYGVTKCCADDLCNIAPSEVGNAGKCYEIQCLGEGCFDEAVEKKAYNLCDRTEYGCEITAGNFTKSNSVTDKGTMSRCAKHTCIVGVRRPPYDLQVQQCCPVASCKTGDASPLGEASPLSAARLLVSLMLMMSLVTFMF